MAATAGSPEYRDAGSGIRDARDAVAAIVCASLVLYIQMAPLAAVRVR